VTYPNQHPESHAKDSDKDKSKGDSDPVLAGGVETKSLFDVLKITNILYLFNLVIY
jgi:hypothetical protein